MSLEPGSRLGAYDIVALIGAGGMGEVYRARDTRLKREVAIKILPDAFATDPERLARFQREAELLATLNHPNIGAVYGFEQSDTSTGSGRASAIVLELVEGETLADRIQRGPIPVKAALSIAVQIAEALEAAHERGIIHRDLKPANIKIGPDEKVKVLDFGLAKAMDASPANAVVGRLSHSPTLSMMATQAGVILGTAAYMSPEQAKGMPADHRSDIFAFGAVLYEMLTGRQPFAGDTAPEVLASVIVRDADLSALAPSLNPRLKEVVGRCLEKVPKKRWQAIGDLRTELESLATAPVANRGSARATLPAWRRLLPIAATALAFALLGAASVSLFRSTPGPVGPMRFVIPLPAEHFLSNTVRQAVDISPDGSTILFLANNTLYFRSLSDFAPRPFSGLEASQGRVLNPVFSPDSTSIAYYSGIDQTIKRIAIGGGAPVTMCAVENPVTGISWGPDGIVYGQGRGGVLRVFPNGGNPERLAEVQAGETAFGPRLLPGGQTLLFTIAQGVGPSRWDDARIVVQPLTTGERKTVIQGGSDARYLPATGSTGYLIYALSGKIFSVPFDLDRLEVLAGPTPVLEGVRRSSANTQGTAQLGVSTTGTLVYFPGPVTFTQREFGLLDRNGIVQPLKLTAGPYLVPRVSPDGQHIAFGSDDGKETAIWLYDVTANTSMRRLTFGGRNRFPIWSSDGQYIAFQSDKEGDLAIFRQRADGSGTAERLTKPEQGVAHMPDEWLPGGDGLLYTEIRGNQFSVWSFTLKDRRSAPFGEMRALQPATPVISPDGRWVAYTSTETGLNQVFVQPITGGGAKYQISKSGGHHAMWTPDGELTYDVTAGVSEIVSITVKPTFKVGNPVVWPRGTMLFSGGANPRPVDMAPDGRIVGSIDASQAEGNPQNAPPIHVVLNWLEELKQLVPLRD